MSLWIVSCSNCLRLSSTNNIIIKFLCINNPVSYKSSDTISEVIPSLIVIVIVFLWYIGWFGASVGSGIGVIKGCSPFHRSMLLLWFFSWFDFLRTCSEIFFSLLLPYLTLSRYLISSLVNFL